MRRTWMPASAGVLILIAGIARLAGGIFIMILGWLGDGIFNLLWYGMPGMHLLPFRNLSLIAFPVAILGVVATLGGIFTLMRRHWGLALTGAIGGAFISWFLGIPAIILIALSKREFK